jgi:hypothetical protein
MLGVEATKGRWRCEAVQHRNVLEHDVAHSPPIVILGVRRRFRRRCTATGR